MEALQETSKTFEGPPGNRYVELNALREEERSDAVRRGLIDDPNKPKALEEAGVFHGTCQDMCPLYEREQREYQNNVERWELNASTGRIDKDLAVKAFHRPAAGNEQSLPSDVRPPEILTRTLDYLIKNIVGGSEPLELTHGFVRDRTRSIRQDFTVQNSRGTEAVECHERIARFHIISLHQLCEVDGFSEQQELEQLRKALQSLAEYYDDRRRSGLESRDEAEFRAYHVLTRMRDPDVLRSVQNLPRSIQTSIPMRQAMQLYILSQRGNEEVGRFKPPNCEGSLNFYSRFFTIIRQPSTSYVMACLCESQFNEIRKGALKSMRKAFLGAHKGPTLEELVEQLGFDDEKQVEDHCELYGIVVKPDEEGVMRAELNKSVNFDETASSLKQTFSRIVEVKRGANPIPQFINGNVKNTVSLDTSSNRLNVKIQPTTSHHNIFNFPVKDISNISHVSSATSAGDSLKTMLPFSNVELTTIAPRPSQPVTFTTSASSSNGLLNRNDTSSAAQQAIDGQSDMMVQQILRGQIREIVQRQITAYQGQQLKIKRDSENKLKRAAMVTALTDELVQGLIRDQVYRIAQETCALSWRRKKLMTKTWRSLSRTAKEVIRRRKLKHEQEMAELQRQKDYQNAFRQLGTVRTQLVSRKRRRSSNVVNCIATPKIVEDAKSSAERFWMPLNLDSLVSNIAAIESKIPWCMLASPASPDSPCQRWFMAKFDLKENQIMREMESKQGPIEIRVTSASPLQTIHVGALIFECSSTGDYDSDRYRFLQLLQQIADRSDFCFPILLIHMGQADVSRTREELMVAEVLSDSKSPVTSCEIICIESMDDVTIFETAVEKLFRSTSACKSPLALEREALLEQEHRRSESMLPLKATLYPARKQPLRNSFYDTRIASTPQAIARKAPAPALVPLQISKLQQSIAAAMELMQQNSARVGTPESPAPLTASL